jgi:ACR3 family arsenite transporter
MNTFERYLTLWVALCIAAGIALGQWFPAPFQAIGAHGDCPRQPAGRAC